MSTILDVKNLVISFRTVSGKVQAVRDISFQLEKGETLAIVGESGSGKSVTSKAIIGILAGNAIVEGGEILYDGKDLLKINEDEFYKIRGDKIAMIFQDPLSSLNPIMRIGRQLTEALLLKGKAKQNASRAAFNFTLKSLKRFMGEAIAKGDKEKEAAILAKCEKFDKFEFKHIELEKAYNEAHECAEQAIEDIDDVLFLIEKHAIKEPKRRMKEISYNAVNSKNAYIVSGDDVQRTAELAGLLGNNIERKVKADTLDDVNDALKEIKEILERSLKKEKPNFFAMGYCVANLAQPLPELPISELNAYMRRELDNGFMLDFLKDAEKALAYSDNHYKQCREKAIVILEQAAQELSAPNPDAKLLSDWAAKLDAPVKACINELDIIKDSPVYTFGPAIKDDAERFAYGVRNNAKAQAKYDRQKARFDKAVAGGKDPGWKVTPAAVVDLELTQQNMLDLIAQLTAHFEQLNSTDPGKVSERTVAIVDYLKENASGVVNKVTNRMARNRAIKLMDEVSISEPHKRYRQYPFEFSGGMRQRIVIAIALAANPDILICDEPTTALDVTIQAQILELINKLKHEHELSVIFITHDLGVVANMADRIAVMYAGKIVEYGTADDIFYSPAHPYTWALLSSMPDLDTNEKLEAIPGTPPNMIFPPKGDAFAERNKYALELDYEMQPPMFKISDTHYAATWLLHPDAPKVEPPKALTERIARMKRRLGGENNAR